MQHKTVTIKIEISQNCKFYEIMLKGCKNERMDKKSRSERRVRKCLNGMQIVTTLSRSYNLDIN